MCIDSISATLIFGGKSHEDGGDGDGGGGGGDNSDGDCDKEDDAFFNFHDWFMFS